MCVEGVGLCIHAALRNLDIGVLSFVGLAGPFPDETGALLTVGLSSLRSLWVTGSSEKTELRSVR